MELSEFLEKLAQTPRDWFLDKAGSIRRPYKTKFNTNTACPITAVDDHGLPSSMYPTSANRLGLSAYLQGSIAYAADIKIISDVNVRTLRNQLLKACSLEENQ